VSFELLGCAFDTRASIHLPRHHLAVPYWSNPQAILSRKRPKQMKGRNKNGKFKILNIILKNLKLNN
jgi:hypothetical protein